MNAVPIIDYSAHPAFAPFAADANQSGTELLGEMLAVDQVLHSSKSIEEFQDASQANWQKMAEILRETVSNESVLHKSMQALEKAHGTMSANVRWCNKPKTRIRKTNPAAAEGYLQQIHDNGCAVMTFPKDVLQTLVEMLADKRAETEARHKLSPTDRCSLHMNLKGQAFDLALKTIRSMGLHTALSELFGREVEPTYWYLAYATAEESWYKNCYADVGIPTSKFAYAHFDNDFELAKVQIYLTEAGEENGPFSFVPGSHQWSGCKTQQFVFKEMDRTFKYPKNESLYYRSRFGTPEYRREFMQLPEPFRGSSHFGDDVLQGTELHQQLDQSFVKVTTDKGNCCAFAGGDLLHYGGLVSGADRWVLQFGFATERPHSAGPAPKQSFLQKIATRGRKYVGNKPVDAIRKVLGYVDEPKQADYNPTA